MARILLIEDDDQVRKMLQKTLERAGYEVEMAAEGGAGLRLFQQNPADLVITDLIMPGKEGLETIREFRQKYGDTKIIAISGGGRVEPETYLLMARKLGAAWAFSKPIDERELLDSIRELLAEEQTEESNA